MESHPSCGLVHSDYDRYIVKTGETIRDFNKTNNNIPSDNLDVSRILRGGKYLYILTCTVMTRRGDPVRGSGWRSRRVPVWKIPDRGYAPMGGNCLAIRHTLHE